MQKTEPRGSVFYTNAKKGLHLIFTKQTLI